MNEKISMLMDGELEDEDADRLLSGLNQDEAEEWHYYHLIGEAIRDPEGFRADLHVDCVTAIEAEPTVLAPHRSRIQKAKVYAWSAAASFAAVAVVGWMALQNPQGTSVPNQVAQAVRLNILKSKLNDYVTAHQEFSPESEMMTSNIRTVSDTYQENGR